MWIFFGTKCLIALKFLSFGVKCAKGRFFWDLKSGHEFKLFPAKNKPLIGRPDMSAIQSPGFWRERAWANVLTQKKLPLVLLYFTILKCANDLNALYYLGITFRHGRKGYLCQKLKTQIACFSISIVAST